MALGHTLAIGIALPHRSAGPIPMTTVRHVARRADELGFADLWVTNNTVDRAHCLDSLVALGYAAAVTARIRLGVAMLVLPTYHPIHVAQQVATLDEMSGGRAILGVGLGRAEEYDVFGVPVARRITRFTESIDLVTALWTNSRVSVRGHVYTVTDATIGARPVQQPHPPIWFGGHHPAAIQRAAARADGWMGAGGSGIGMFTAAVPRLRAALEDAGRDPDDFTISKRVFVSVHERDSVARAELARWFGEVYGRPDGVDECGIAGTPEHVADRLAAHVAAGANHLLLEPVTRHEEQIEGLAEIAGLRPGSRSRRPLLLEREVAAHHDEHADDRAPDQPDRRSVVA